MALSKEGKKNIEAIVSVLSAIKWQMFSNRSQSIVWTILIESETAYKNDPDK